MCIGGDWPEVEGDPYTLYHVKRMARELNASIPAWKVADLRRAVRTAWMTGTDNFECQYSHVVLALLGCETFQDLDEPMPRAPATVAATDAPKFKTEEQSMNEQATEAAIQATKPTAPRLTPADIDRVIVDVDYHNFPGTTVTICLLKLKNGFGVTGESAAVSMENFDADIGRKIAHTNAREKIWALEGYLLRERLYSGQ
jgi:hypothetical protein